MADSAMNLDDSSKDSAPSFPPISISQLDKSSQYRKISVPPNRFTPLKNNWMKIYTPIVNHMKLEIRMNINTKCVELRTSPQTEDAGALQKSADFVRGFMLGFEVDDAMALLRMDDLYIESFKVQDVKTLQGDSLSRAVGRISGSDGKTKYTIENATRTRIVLADCNVHILGSVSNIKIARDAICDLILGSPPGKVYGKLQSTCARLKERF
eukprot:TRINITY_DN15501_c0_g1_i1.p1 TRINITY_DN15501_c0_g1~~TRINITY_DN15501_c0_g1_i1.p1  ORF type:complete len:232 (-),score=36.45 TRINITY_DN15501_c0_g1_i1:115-747(-)